MKRTKLKPISKKMMSVFKTTEGMSLRDYFAGQALNGLLEHVLHDESVATSGEADASLAKASYEIADAMLAAREATQAKEEAK